MLGLSMSFGRAERTFAELPLAGISPTRLQRPARHLRACSNEAGISRQPFTRPHRSLRYLKTVTGSKFPLYLFDSLTSIHKTVPTLTSRLEQSRSSGAFNDPWPLASQPQRHLQMLFQAVAPLQDLSFRINAPDRGQPPEDLPSGSPDLPSLP
jgi:hypothetical protein